MPWETQAMYYKVQAIGSYFYKHWAQPQPLRDTIHVMKSTSLVPYKSDQVNKS